MNRLRKALGIVALVLGNSCKESETLANKLLERFPNQIPSAAEVKKYRTPGAKYILVHIKQTHFSEGPFKSSELSLDEKLEIYASIDRSQRDIYRILSYLVDTGFISEVRSEGFTTENTPSIQNEYLSVLDKLRNASIFRVDPIYLYAGVRVLKRMVNGEEAIPDNSNIDDIRREYEKNQKEFDVFKYVPGGALVLALENRLRIKPSETNVSRDDAFDRREDTVLIFSTQSDAPLQTIIFGANHDLRDNIKRWNRSHEDNKLSLIIITPDANKK